MISVHWSVKLIKMSFPRKGENRKMRRDECKDEKWWMGRWIGSWKLDE